MANIMEELGIKLGHKQEFTMTRDEFNQLEEYIQDRDDDVAILKDDRSNMEDESEALRRLVECFNDAGNLIVTDEYIAAQLRAAREFVEAYNG